MFFCGHSNNNSHHFFEVVQHSSFAQMNALCNLSHKLTAATSRLISEQALVHAVYNNHVTMEVEPRIGKLYK